MPRPRSVSRSGDAVISNAELARIFSEIGDMLEIMGEVVYKAVAYRRVADAVERYPEDVASLFRRGEPPKLPGAGPALDQKLAELSETGRLEYHDQLRAQVPDGLLEILRIPGVGPRTVKLLHEELASTRWRRCGPRPQTDGCAASRASPSGPSRTSWPASRRLGAQDHDRVLLHEADDARWPGSSSGCARCAGVRAHRAGRVAPPAAGRPSATSTCWPPPTIRRS